MCGTAHGPKHSTSFVKHIVMAWACMAVSGNGTLMFIDVDEFWGVQRHTVCSNSKHRDNDPTHKSKETQEFIKAMKCNIIEWPSQSPDVNPVEHAFNSLKTNHQTESPTN